VACPDGQGVSEYSWVLLRTYEGDEKLPEDPDLPWRYPAIIIPMKWILARVCPQANQIHSLVGKYGYKVVMGVNVVSDSRELPFFELTTPAVGCLGRLGADLKIFIRMDAVI
jgi:hypothetical protein